MTPEQEKEVCELILKFPLSYVKRKTGLPYETCKEIMRRNKLTGRRVYHPRKVSHAFQYNHDMQKFLDEFNAINGTNFKLKPREI